MIHWTVEMSRETLFDKQRRELQHGQQQVLVGLMAGRVTRQHPRTVGLAAPLQNIVKFVQHVHPVWQLALSNNR